MRLAFKMEYRNPVSEKSVVELIPYSSIYQEEYKRVYNEAFHEMREALGKEPIDFIQDDSFFESGMDVVFLLTDKAGMILGSVALKDEIDDLFVTKDYQGRGIGKQILLWAIERFPSEKIVLHVSEWNEKAVRLYQETGFEIVESIVIA